MRLMAGPNTPCVTSVRDSAGSRRRQRGFTILELMIVLAILIAIMGIVLVNVMGQKGKADVRIAQAQIKAFEGMLNSFKVDLNRWPTDEEGIPSLWSKDALTEDGDKDKWGGPYTAEPKPNDEWGSPWIYRAPSEATGKPFVASAGPDKQEGTEDDITNGGGDGDGSGGDDLGDFSDGSSSGSGSGS
jgi:general secretion pathway protein G